MGWQADGKIGQGGALPHDGQGHVEGDRHADPPPGGPDNRADDGWSTAHDGEQRGEARRMVAAYTDQEDRMVAVPGEENGDADHDRGGDEDGGIDELVRRELHDESRTCDIAQHRQAADVEAGMMERPRQHHPYVRPGEL